jgi:Rrf2 family protein
MISKKAKYGLKAVLFLARHQDRGPVLISEIAASQQIPKKFLELILLDLRNCGLLRSKKGKGGGYSLARRAQEISLGSVLRSLDGPLAPLPCVSGSAYRRCDECEDETTCGIRLAMKDARDAMAAVLDGTSLADVLDRTAALETELSKALSYYI